MLIAAILAGVYHAASRSPVGMTQLAGVAFGSKR